MCVVCLCVHPWGSLFFVSLQQANYLREHQRWVPVPGQHIVVGIATPGVVVTANMRTVTASIIAWRRIASCLPFIYGDAALATAEA